MRNCRLVCMGARMVLSHYDVPIIIILITTRTTVFLSSGWWCSCTTRSTDGTIIIHCRSGRNSRTPPFLRREGLELRMRRGRSPNQLMRHVRRHSAEKGTGLPRSTGGRPSRSRSARSPTTHLRGRGGGGGGRRRFTREKTHTVELRRHHWVKSCHLSARPRERRKIRLQLCDQRHIDRDLGLSACRCRWGG